MSRRIALPLAVLLVSSSAGQLSAQDSPDFSTVLGAWEMTLETPRGSMTQSFTATIAGDHMTGTISGGRGGGQREFTAVRSST